jgi:hypothetical protein
MFEVVEAATGARMAWTPSGDMMSTTLFKSVDAAKAWMAKVGLTDKTHGVRPARI